MCTSIFVPPPSPECTLHFCSLCSNYVLATNMSDVIFVSLTSSAHPIIEVLLHFMTHSEALTLGRTPLDE